MGNEKIYTSKKELLKFLEIKENFLYADFTLRYGEQEKLKKNGGIRIIRPPHFNLKKIQRKILDGILYRHTQLACVYGLSKEKGILSNAKMHRENFTLDLLTLDIEDFFPTISNKKIKMLFKKIGFNKENSLILTKICTINNSLPQGAPTSPYLASMVCFRLDKEIYLYCKRRNFIYTRYFDDISISGHGIKKEHTDNVEKIILKHGFKSKESKKDFFGPSVNKIINGVVMTEYGLTVSDDYKKEIWNTYLSLQADNNIQNRRIFSGKFGFYLHINKKEALNFLDKLKTQNTTKI